LLEALYVEQQLKQYYRRGCSFDLSKIWAKSENVGKIPENTDKNDAQRGENHMKTFF